ncbi:MAG: penicillin acylase family protein [Bacteroidota bacterium]
MKFFKFIVSLAITVGLFYALNTKIDPAPPLGKFLNPTTGFWQQAEPQDMLPGESLDLEGLNEPVDVVYDEHLIPHIYAKNNHDLYYAQGYITATNRLWQMEFQTHAAAGRISEIIGNQAMDFDRTARRKGMVFAAEIAVKEMMKNEIIKEEVEAYADGVNAYINSLTDANLPLEYKLLDYQPEAWTPLKSGLLLKYMANNLNGRERDLQNTNALIIFGREVFDILYPDMEDSADPVVEKPGQWDFEPVVLDSINDNRIAEVINRDLIEGPNPYNGSNNWAVDSSKTASGNAILSNDPHLGLNLPSLWYVAHLNSPDVNVLGGTLPGAPNVVIGYNDSIAWGVTNAKRDLVDWYKIQFKSDDKSEYMLDDEWVKSEMKIEEIKIRGEESFYDTVYYTHFGPVMYDDKFHPDSEKKYYAFRWITHDPSEEMRALYELNRAKNYDDYTEALNYWLAPAQNFAFASVKGDIAMRVQGKFPNKRYEEGKFLLDGTTTQHDWTFIPNEHNVMYRNPERGFVSSANQYPADSTYPYYVYASSYANYRNRRINNVLRETEVVTIQTMMDLQNDYYNLKAAESIPVFLTALDSIEMNATEREAFNQLSGWDYMSNVTSVGASYYEKWWKILYPMIWDEMINGEVAVPYPTTYTTIKLIKGNPDFELFDIDTTAEKEDAEILLIRSFRQMAEEMADLAENNRDELEWSNFKDSYVRHLLRIEPFGRYNLSIGGNGETVNAMKANHGPSWRMIVELDPSGPKAYGIYPGGQSGNPGSRYYDNYIDSWVEGEYMKLQLENSSGEIKKPLVKQTLNPSEK